MDNVLTETSVPRLHDSHSENVRLDPSFLAFFRQSLLHNTSYCADPACCSIFDVPQFSPLQGNVDTATSSGLRYPLLLFEDLLHILPHADLSQRANDFYIRVLPSLPFLSRIPSLAVAATDATNGSDVSFHMGLCKVLLGSTSNNESDYVALWHATASLILGAFEIDNSLGRRLDWLTSAVLVVASGAMQTDPLVRTRTAIVNGCVQAFVFRSDYLLQPHTAAVTNTEVVLETEITPLRSFYFLCETLRSIHHRTPLTLEPSWSVPLGRNGQYDLRDMTEDLVTDQQELPLDLTIADYLLILIQLLADSNNLLCTWASFTEETFALYGPTPMHDYSTSTRGQVNTASNDWSADSHGAKPSLPLTADAEYNRIRLELTNGLLFWETGFRRDFATDESPIALSMIPLFHFTKLLLKAGVVAYALSDLSGYLHADTSDPYTALPHQQGIWLDDAVVQIAADVLASIDRQRSREVSSGHATAENRAPCQMWYPFALFYSGLVIWAKLDADKAKNAASHVLLPWRNLLQMSFQLLHTLRGDYGCVSDMTAVLQRLLALTESDLP